MKLALPELQCHTHWSLRALLRIDTLGFLGCIVIFYLWPQLDLIVSGLFYDSDSASFPLRHHPLADFIYDFTNTVGSILLIGLILLAVLTLFNWHTFSKLKKTTIYFLLVVLIIGPGILVNNIIKETWSRPRPRQVIEFGGEYQFQTPFNPRPFLDKGKSFVSGHAAIGFYFLTFALLSRKRKWLLLPLVTGTIVGATRIVQGGHFLSDVIFSGWVLWYCSIFFYYLFYKEKPFPSLTAQ